MILSLKVYRICDTRKLDVMRIYGVKNYPHEHVIPEFGMFIPKMGMVRGRGFAPRSAESQSAVLLYKLAPEWWVVKDLNLYLLSYSQACYHYTNNPSGAR